MLQMFKKLEINMNTTEKQKLKKKKKDLMECSTTSHM